MNRREEKKSKKQRDEEFLRQQEEEAQRLLEEQQNVTTRNKFKRLRKSAERNIHERNVQNKNEEFANLNRTPPDITQRRVRRRQNRNNNANANADNNIDANADINDNNEVAPFMDVDLVNENAHIVDAEVGNDDDDNSSESSESSVNTIDGRGRRFHEYLLIDSHRKVKNEDLYELPRISSELNQPEHRNDIIMNSYKYTMKFLDSCSSKKLQSSIITCKTNRVERAARQFGKTIIRELKNLQKNDMENFKNYVSVNDEVYFTNAETYDIKLNQNYNGQSIFNNISSARLQHVNNNNNDYHVNEVVDVEVEDNVIRRGKIKRIIKTKRKGFVTEKRQNDVKIGGIYKRYEDIHYSDIFVQFVRIPMNLDTKKIPTTQRNISACDSFKFFEYYVF